MVFLISVLLWLVTPLFFGSYWPVPLAAGGLMALAWMRHGRLALILAFLAGIYLDINTGGTLGLKALFLVATVVATWLIKEHWPQGWALAITASVVGLIWSLIIYGRVAVWAVLGCIAFTLGWRGLIWYISGKNKGVYLK